MEDNKLETQVAVIDNKVDNIKETVQELSTKLDQFIKKANEEYVTKTYFDAKFLPLESTYNMVVRNTIWLILSSVILILIYNNWGQFTK